MDLAGLEEQLSVSWDREHLEVYADALQAAGDPRGELIAYDLHTDARASTMTIEQRSRDLAGAWLGDLSRDPALSWRYGFLDFAIDATTTGETITKVLGGPLGHVVRALRVTTPEPRRIKRVVELAAATRRPWLTRLSLDYVSAFSDETIIPGALAAALVAATPRLRSVSVHGRAVMAGFTHPSVRRMRVTGWDALSTLSRPGAPHTALVELDFELGSSPPTPAQLGSLLHGARLPALRQLDCSRNANAQSGVPAIFALLRESEIVPQLTHLRVPTIDSYGARERAQRIVDRAVELVEMQTTSRGRVDLYSTLHHVRAKIVAVLPHLWPPPPSIGCHASLVVVAAEEVPLEALVVTMRRAYTELTPAARRAWEQLYTFLEHLVDEDPGGGNAGEFPSLVLLEILEAALALPRRTPGPVYFEVRDDPRWEALASFLRAAEAPPTVTVRRFWP